MTKKIDTKYGNPWRTGFVDALHGRESRSPFPRHWWDGKANKAYHQGYADGLENRRQLVESIKREAA